MHIKLKKKWRNRATVKEYLQPKHIKSAVRSSPILILRVSSRGFENWNIYLKSSKCTWHPQNATISVNSSLTEQFVLRKINVRFIRRIQMATATMITDR